MKTCLDPTCKNFMRWNLLGEHCPTCGAMFSEVVSPQPAQGTGTPTGSGITDAYYALSQQGKVYEKEYNFDLVVDGVQRMLTGFGVDLSDPNFADTPRRVAKLYQEMFTPPENNWNTFPEEKYDQMVILRDHRVFAVCPHHLMPVEVRCYVGYIPNDHVLGLSKLARVVEQQLTRPMMQEELTRLTVDALHAKLKPKGVMAVMAGVHGCMRYRGVQTTGDVVTSAVKGLFLTNPAVRQEFNAIIGRP